MSRIESSTEEIKVCTNKMSPFDKRKKQLCFWFHHLRVWLFFLSVTQNVLFSQENKQIIFIAIFACFLCIVSNTASSAAPQMLELNPNYYWACGGQGQL
jgi:hypothetical protein